VEKDMRVSVGRKSGGADYTTTARPCIARPARSRRGDHRLRRHCALRRTPLARPTPPRDSVSIDTPA